MRALLAQRLALTGADAAFHLALRAQVGLVPSQAAAGVRPGLGYCGREFRAYPSMRIGEAARFYRALSERWNGDVLAADLRAAGLDERFEIKRMKTAYQRVLVLAFALAVEPSLLVVEAGDELDEPAALAFLERAVARTPRALVTYGAPEAAPAFFDAAVPAAGFDLAGFLSA